MNEKFASIWQFLSERFSLSHEKADHFETIKSIEKGVEFKGINVWTLVFAIFVASIGLNVNSAAVIIGAMLISPLMGPIMGLGLSVGIFDFSLLKKSLKNLVIMVSISVITSATYFFISPLNEAQSELLARTTPTIYDVLIALFGGLAGIVAGATKEKGNTIQGVAIATALMPPLCTAGFGLATGNVYYFLGAFYLFFINAVMISLSTFMIVRFLQFPFKQEVNKTQANIVKKYIYIVVIVTVLPSIYFAYRIISETIFKSNAIHFVNTEMNFEQTQILSKTFEFNHHDSSQIQLVLAGKVLEEDEVNELRKRMADYSLTKTKLLIKQGIDNARNIDLSQIRNGIIEDIYLKNEKALASKDEKIKMLENELIAIRSVQFPIKDITEEINAINPNIYAFSANKIVFYNLSSENMDTTLAVNIKMNGRLNEIDYQIINNWLKKRLHTDELKILVD